ncbi:hypothetical protein GQ42DRAFT_163774 [Ramicandelaber brevisporus]|nr:hypothetical protein GQ42DRAFT_163774 [Ramicandelaber brevisporus]
MVSFAANLVAQAFVIFSLDLWSRIKYSTTIPGASEWPAAEKYIIAEDVLMITASIALLCATVAMGIRSSYLAQGRPLHTANKFVSEQTWPRILRSSGGMIVYLLIFGLWHVVGTVLSWKFYNAECGTGKRGIQLPFGDGEDSPCRAVIVASAWRIVNCSTWVAFAAVGYIVHKVTERLDRKWALQTQLIPVPV